MNPVESVARRFEDHLGDVVTERRRLAAMPTPEPAPGDDRGADAERLRAAAESPSASTELVRIGRAVRAGRTTYDAIVAGAADHLDVVAAAKTTQRQRFHELAASGAVRLVLDHDTPAEPAGPRVDDDEQPESFLVRSDGRTRGR